MIEQHQFRLQPPVGCAPTREWGYRLYAALLERLPPKVGQVLHQDAITPISQYAVPQPDGSLLWVVSLFGEEIISQVAPVLRQSREFALCSPAVVLRVCSRSSQCIHSVEELLAQAECLGSETSLTFVTPVAFKSRGRYVCLPELRLILQNLMRQWNGCFPQCPIEDVDGQGLAALVAGLECTGLQLRSEPYYLKGSSVMGCVGRLWLRNRMTGFHRTLINALLLFGGYSGIGIKTTLGMGACQVQWKN